MAPKCQDLGDALSAYLDGELDQATRGQVEAHLASCPGCNAELEGLRQVKRFMAPGSPLAPVMAKDLADRVRAKTYPKPRWRLSATRRPGLGLATLWRAGPALAIMLVVILLGALVATNLLTPSPVQAAAEASLNDHVFCAKLGRVIQSLPGNADQVSSQLSTTLGMSIAQPSAIPAGFNFAGGRAIHAGNITAIHLAWLKGPSMLSFYQSADPGGPTPDSWQKVERDGRTFWQAPNGDKNAILWRGGGILYILVSDLPDDQLIPIALTGPPPQQ